MSDLLAGKTVLLAGAGEGLGAEIARRVLREGGSLMLGARNQKRLQKLARELDSTGAKVQAQQLDVADESSCTAFVAAAKERFGRLDAVVPVAAVDNVFGGLQEAAAADWRAVMDVNVVGALQLVRAAAPALAADGGGAVVFIGSQGYALPPDHPQMAYAASKAALLSASLQLARELGPQGVRVNTVVPTWMWGPAVQGYVRWQAGERGVTEAALRAELARKFALGEMPEDGDVAEVVVLFCSERMRMVTGQYLRVDAGERMTL